MTDGPRSKFCECALARTKNFGNRKECKDVGAETVWSGSLPRNTRKASVKSITEAFFVVLGDSYVVVFSGI